MSKEDSLREIAQKMYEPKDPRKHNGFLKPGVGVVILNENDEILMERRSDCGLWGLLGGKMDVGESVEETLHREVFEETGFKVEVVKFLGVYSASDRVVTYLDNGDVAQLVDFVFVVRPTSGSLTISHESLELQFFNPKEIPLEELVPPARQPLEDYLAGKSCVIA